MQTHATIETLRHIEGSAAVAAWNFYDEVFRPANDRAPSRQSYHQSEFLAVLRDQAVTKILATDEVGNIKGLAVCTFDFTKMSWVSPEFFARRFPALSGKLMYVPVICVSAADRSLGVGAALMNEIKHVLRASEGLGIAFDHSDNLNRHLPQMIAWATGGMFLPRLDSQVFEIVLDVKGSFWGELDTKTRLQLETLSEGARDSDRALFSPTDLVHQCLIDEERVVTFQEAISRSVRPGSLVLEIGTGTSVLAMMAARAGAARVICVEANPSVARQARDVVKANGLQGRVEIIIGDARELDLTGLQPEVVICELLSTGCVDEYQIPAINNLHQTGVIGEHSVVIPARLDTWVTLANTDFALYGFEFPVVKHLWKQYEHRPRVDVMSELASLVPFDFRRPLPSEIHHSTNFRAQRSGAVNSVVMNSAATLSDDLRLSNTLAFLPTVVIPVPPVMVSSGDQLSLSIQYTPGKGWGGFTVSWLPPE